MRQRTFGKGVRLFQTANQHLRLPQGETTAHRFAYHFRGSGSFQRLREQWHGIGDAPAQGVRRPQGRSHRGEIAWEVRFLTDAHGPFEPREGPGQVALAQGHETDSQ